MDTINFVSSLRQQALLLGDYNAYRRMCTRRLAKLRKRLGRVTDPKKKEHKPAPVTAQDIAKDPRHAHLLLYRSERAWAHSMHLKSFSADTADGPSHAIRNHIRSRLAKSYSHAITLQNLYFDTTSTASRIDVVEVAAYASSLSGALAIEKRHWEDALKALSLSRVAYDALIVAAAPAGGEIYKEFLTSTVEPSIRYAAYQMGIPRTTEIVQVARKFFPKDADEGLVERIGGLNPRAFGESAEGGAMDGMQQTPTITSANWRGRVAVIEDADIAVALGAAQKAEEGLRTLVSSRSSDGKKTTAEDFDGLLLAWQDCVDETKKTIDKAVSEGVSGADPKLQKLQLIFTYVNYKLISWRIGRNRLLAEGIEAGMKESNEVEQWRLKELIALYDAILQSVDQITELPGVAADEEFSQELEAKRGFFAALRCMAIAPSHLAHNTRNTLALYHLALTHVSRSLPYFPASSSLDASNIHSLSITSIHATQLKSFLEALVTRFTALIQLQEYNNANVSGAKDHPPLIDTLNKYSENVNFGRLVPLPPRIEGVPVKPIFFDIAWNFVGYPGQTEEKAGGRANEKANALDGTAKKGGFLGGLFRR